VSRPITPLERMAGTRGPHSGGCACRNVLSAAFSDVKQQALLTTYESRETAEVLGNTCRPTQLLTRIADRPPLPRHATWRRSRSQLSKGERSPLLCT
jgi:hypothetical protein